MLEGAGAYIKGGAGYETIHVTLSLNPFPRERDLPSLRSNRLPYHSIVCWRGLGLVLRGVGGYETIHVTLSLNPFPRERDLPSLRSNRLPYHSIGCWRGLGFVLKWWRAGACIKEVEGKIIMEKDIMKDCLDLYRAEAVQIFLYF